MIRWLETRVSTEDSVAAAKPVSGRVLRDRFFADMQTLSLGFIRAKDSALMLGPIELLRFGTARVTRTAVEWPIEGGLLVGMPGGRWRIEAAGGQISASVSGYRPRLPRLLYISTQLHVHHLLTRLYLLRVRGREPAVGMRASYTDRVQAALVDASLCATLMTMTGRRFRMRTLLGIAVGYHVACWSISGRTLGGLVMRQRVVAVDGSRLSPAQALLRMAALPLSWIAGRPVHDEVACTDVIQA